MHLPESPELARLRAAIDFPDGLEIAQHRVLIEAVRQQHPHSIHFHSNAPQDNCVTYVLGLAGAAPYRAIAVRYSKLFAGADYVRFLLDGRLKLTDVPAVGHLALYFELDKWRHIGRLLGETQVRSKWGLFPVYDHTPAEVPMRYGERVLYALPVEPTQALAWFLEWVRSCGLQASEIEWVTQGV
jgi:hypothetical protein